jgi:hypothetical protein
MKQASATPAAGYSGTPLARKLGIQAGMRLLLVNPPALYTELLAPLPEPVFFVRKLGADVDLMQIFSTDRADLARRLAQARERLGPEAVVWVSWPKKAAKVPTDITEDVVREVALPLGFVDVKVCAVDAVWSGLKLVVRKALR